MSHPPDVERLWSKIDTSGSGCWPWTGATANGYGRMTWAGKRRYVHRIVYELLVGPIPDGYTIDHLCRNTICANPTHLEAVTRGENVRRGDHPSARAFREDRCFRGHSLSDAYRFPDGRGRTCRTCIRERKRRYASMKRKVAV